MNIKDIFIEILDIASQIGNNTLSYPLAPLVIAGKRSSPANPLTQIAARFDTEITNSITPSKSKVESALKDLKEVAKNYRIEQLKKPIKELTAYLNNLT